MTDHGPSDPDFWRESTPFHKVVEDLIPKQPFIEYPLRLREKNGLMPQNRDLKLLSDALDTNTVGMHWKANGLWGFWLWGGQEEEFTGPTLLDAWKSFLDHHDVEALRTYIDERKKV